ncbi:MAG: RNA 2',3'-cyclic phosphodiesterase [Thiogranum sp.]|nr:RNA 2',3'-cyclic phosphodiesterase [Thiogranum sp.]
MDRKPEATQRLFFALWPDDEVRSQLATAARCWTQHPIPGANLHMTLAFLGNRTTAERQCFSEAVSTVRCNAFELLLDYCGAWPRRGISWLGASRIPEELMHLVRQLNAVLQPCGYEPEKRRFIPHITLSRKEKNPQPQSAEKVIRWQVGEFVLAESTAGPEGVCYQPVQRWPLQVSA